jgi:hypothetical protein
MPELTPVDLISIEKSVDWDGLRHGKAALFAIAFQMGAAIQRGDADEAMTNTYKRLTSLLEFVDYIQSRAARTLGERTIFGDNEEG